MLAPESLKNRNGNRGDISHRVDQAQRKARTRRNSQNSRASGAVLTLEVKHHSAVNLRANSAVARNNGSQRIHSHAERKQMRKAVIHSAACFPPKSALSALRPDREEMRPADQRVYPRLQAAVFAKSHQRTD